MPLSDISVEAYTKNPLLLPVEVINLQDFEVVTANLIALNILLIIAYITKNSIKIVPVRKFLWP